MVINIPERIKSRKLWSFLGALALLLAGDNNLLFLSPELQDALVKLVMTYIGGQAAVDAVNALKK